MAFFVAGMAGAQEHVTNGNFSSGSQSWNLDSRTGVESCCANPPSGYPNAYAHPTGTGGWSALWQDVPGLAGGSYTLSGKIRTSGGVQRAWLQADNGNPSQTYCKTPETNIGSWQTFSCNFSISSGSVVHVALFANNDSGTGGGWITFDDISLTGGGGGGLPDVTITSLTWTPSNPSPGDAVQFHAVVRNVGSVTTPDIVGVGFWAPNFFGWGTHGPMSPGQTATISLTGGPGANRWVPSSSGSFSISAKADDVNRFVESNESNNSRGATVTVGGGGGLPDVTITSLSWTPSNPNVGDAVQFHAVVRNVGSVATPDIVGVGFSTSDGFFGWGSRGPMTAGQTATISLSGGPSGSRWTPSSAGNVTLTAHADDVNRFTESNEGNNTRTGNVSVGGGGGGPLDLLSYIVPSNQSFRVYSRLIDSHGNQFEEVFGYRNATASHGLSRRFFVKNDSGFNWEEFGWDSQYIYRYRDSSWGETCDDGQPAFYQTTDTDRTAFARWLPRFMSVGETFISDFSHFVDAGYKRVNSCNMSCANQYEGWVVNRGLLKAHHAEYTTIHGLRIDDVIELERVDVNGNPEGDRFFYAKNLGLVGFEGPIQGQGVRSGAHSIDPNVGGAPNFVDLCPPFATDQRR